MAKLVDRVLQDPNPFKKQDRDPLIAANAAEGSEALKAKPVAKQKKAKTITALVTSRYEAMDAETTCVARQQSQPSDEQFKREPADDGKKKKKQRSKKVPVKPKEPEYIVLSPEAVTKSLNNQDLLFGTCSQLERDDSPTFLRETQRALAASEHFSELDNLLDQTSTSVSSEGIASRFTSSKSLWSAATRNSNGFVVQPEILDMTNSPEIRSSHRRAVIQDMSNSHKVSTESTSSTSERIISRESSTQKKTDDTSSQTRLGRSSSREPIANSTQKASTKAPEMPRYSGFTDDELRKQVTSYGFKPVRGRNKMISLLEKCWQSKQTAPTSTAEERRTKSLDTIAEETTKILTKKQPTKKQLGRTKNATASDTMNSQKTQKLKAVSKQVEARIDSLSEKVRLSPPSAISVEEIADSEEEPEARSTRIQMQSKSSIASRRTRPASSRASSLCQLPTDKANIESLDLSDQITKAIRSQPRPKQFGSKQGPSLTWHEKILLYDPVILEDLATWLNTEGLGLIGEDREVGAGFVRTWCESKGVCCTYRTK